MFSLFKKPKLKDSQYQEQAGWQAAYEEKTNSSTKAVSTEIQRVDEVHPLIDSVEKKLRAANQLKNNIDVIDHFLTAAEQTWTGSLSSAAYGSWESRSIKLDTELKNQMLDVLRKRRVEYVQQIQEIMEFKEDSNGNN